jgi:molecular chaperone IbpA
MTNTTRMNGGEIRRSPGVQDASARSGPGLEFKKPNSYLKFAGARRVRATVPRPPKKGLTGTNIIANSRSQEDTMRHVDFSPLYRSTVGFDRLFTMLDSLAQPDQAQTYPPYNIERTGENTYRITMAVAGFDEKELSLEAHAHVLSVKGEKSEETKEGSDFLYRGIAKRAFERRFQLADHVEVQAASLKNGLLHIDLLRNIPEAMKPRKIAIAAELVEAPKAIEARVS